MTHGNTRKEIEHLVNQEETLETVNEYVLCIYDN